MARKDTDRRITATLDADRFDKIKYVAEKRGQSLSECLRDSVDLMIRYANEDYYPLAKLEAQRINQFYDLLMMVLAEIKTVGNITLEGFSSLLTLTRGDNYLFDEDESDLNG